MNKRIKIFLISQIFILCVSCGGWQDFEAAIGGAKKKSTDEYLIQKKDPLILPPNYEKLPLPSSDSSDRDEVNRVQSILDQDDSSKENKRKKTDLEKSIEKELRKNN